MDWKNKNVLVTGSHGMIGKELVFQLIDLGAKVHSVDIKSGVDLTMSTWCEAYCFGMDYVFHLVGVKGSPKMTNERPVDFMEPMLKCDTNMICAANKAKVKGFLYTSSIAVENPNSDKYPAWAKRTGETLIEAMRIQYPYATKWCIVRPANVYGRFDNFDNPNAMVITSLISKALSSPSFEVWGNGTQIRDFIEARDVARGMIQAMSEMPETPVNLCSGVGVSIKEVATLISKYTNKEAIYLNNENIGEQVRVMAVNWDFKPVIKLEEGIKIAIQCAKA